MNKFFIKIFFSILILEHSTLFADSQIRIYCVDENGYDHKLMRDRNISFKINSIFNQDSESFEVDENEHALLTILCRDYLKGKRVKLIELKASQSESWESLAWRYPLSARPFQSNLWQFVDELDTLVEVQSDDDEPFPFLYEESPEVENFGFKSIYMNQKLEDSGLDKDHLYHNENIYEIITGKTKNFTLLPLASIGAGINQREIITIDRSDKKALDKIFKFLLIEIKERYLAHGNKEIDDLSLIKHVKDFIRIYVFSKNSKSHPIAYIDSLNEFYFQKIGHIITSNKIRATAIPLSIFLNEKVGLCRHFSIIFAYLISRLQNIGFLKNGEVHIQRDVLPENNGHAWNIFAYKDGSKILHVDTMWNMILDLNEEHRLTELYNYYGREAIYNERERYKDFFQFGDRMVSID